MKGLECRQRLDMYNTAHGVVLIRNIPGLDENTGTIRQSYALRPIPQRMGENRVRR